MIIPPPEVVAKWPTPNYEDPQTHGHATLIVNLIFLSFAIIAVLLRCYYRLSKSRKLELDDLVTVVALVRDMLYRKPDAH